MQRYIFEEEMAAAGAPGIAPFGPTMCASVLHKFGTPQQIVFSPANDYVARFVAHINPLTVLRAADIAVAPETLDKAVKLAATAKPDTPIAAIIGALAKRDGAIGLMEGGRITGAITSNDVVRAISRFMDRGNQVSSAKDPQ